MAVRLPMPPMNGSGTRKPNSARLGMVCAMLAKPTAQRRGPGRRERRTPPGSAMAHGDRDGDGHHGQMFQREGENFGGEVAIHAGSGAREIGSLKEQTASGERGRGRLRENREKQREQSSRPPDRVVVGKGRGTSADDVRLNAETQRSQRKHREAKG